MAIKLQKFNQILPAFWQGPSLKLGCTSIHVWMWSLEGERLQSRFTEAVLSQEELLKMASFRRIEDQVRYALSHTMLRFLISKYVSVTPENLCFARSKRGKPLLRASSSIPTIEFNLSHTNDRAILAVASHTMVGVDIEKVTPIESSVANHFFSPTEQRQLAQLDGKDWLKAFYTCWTRKEALLKGEGLGLLEPLNLFTVSLRATEPAALLERRAGSGLTQVWYLTDLDVGVGHVAALAINRREAEVICYELVGDHLSSKE